MADPINAYIYSAWLERIITPEDIITAGIAVWLAREK